MEITQDNNCLIGGNTGDISPKDFKTTSDFLVVKLDFDGNQLWEKTYDIAANDIMTNIIQNKDASFLLSGYTTSNNKKSLSKREGIEDYIVIKLDAEGEQSWKESVGTKQKEVLRRSIETRDGGYVLLGTSIKTGGTNDANFWVVKLLDKEKPKHKKKLIEAIPNPTREYSSVVIGYDYEYGTAMVVDIAGRVLETFELTGSRLIPIQVKNYPDGVYIVQIKTNVQTDSTKIIKTSE